MRKKLFEVSIQVIEHIIYKFKLLIVPTTSIIGVSQLLVCENNHFVLYSVQDSTWTSTDSDRLFSNSDMQTICDNHPTFCITSTNTNSFSWSVTRC